MSYELFIARRLRLKVDDAHGLSPSIIIAIVGIALSLAVMMAAMCIVFGFKNQIREKVLGFDANVTILPGSSYNGSVNYPFIDFTPQLQSIINDTGMFKSSTLVLEQPSIIKTDCDYKGIIVKGMTPGDGWQFVSENIVEGSLPDYTDQKNANKIAISRITANSLNLNIGDKVYAYFFNDNNIRTRRLEISAIYDTHFGDYDKIYIFAPISLTQALNGVTGNVGNKVELRTFNFDQINDASIKLQDAMFKACATGELTGLYRLSNVNSTAMMYFNWLELLDTNVVVILILMSLVSGFTLISSLFIIILERINMIGIMKALGATNSEIRRIFIYIAQRLIVYGLLAGNIIGLTIMLLQKHFHIFPLDPDAYYLNYVPVEIDWLYIALLNIGVFIIAWLMILLPSHLVSTISPSRSIRYE